MNKILVIPDVHGRTFWKDAVSKHLNDCDKTIFLGDYLDEYPDENITRNESKQNFEEIIKLKQDNLDKVVFLLGNHDLHYISDSFTKSSRRSSSNARTYKEMFLSHMSFFKIAHEEIINDKKFLFTHAGVMKSWYDRNKETIGELTVDNLNKLQNFKGGILALGEVSKYRSWFGENSGSPIWSDVREKIDDDKSEIGHVVDNDDSSVDEYDYQIFGHTLLTKNPIITDKWTCLDCKRAFLIDNEGNIKES
jgi:predicted phosphodiesterase